MQKTSKRSREDKKTKGSKESATFSPGKYLYVHNFGADGRIIFSSQEDFDRFEAYLYLLNSTQSPRASNFFADNRTQNIFETGRGDRLVSIGAFSFTPKDFHILVTPKMDGGIAKFMQKLQTAYTMYYNKKYAHSGRVFHSGYKSEHARDDAHLKYLAARIHLNPAQLFNAHWEDTEVTELGLLARRAMGYRYSSVNEYVTSKYIITTPIDFPKYVRNIKHMHTYFKSWNRSASK